MVTFWSYLSSYECRLKFTQCLNTGLDHISYCCLNLFVWKFDLLNDISKDNWINTDPCRDDVSVVSSFYSKCPINVLIDL